MLIAAAMRVLLLIGLLARSAAADAGDNAVTESVITYRDHITIATTGLLDEFRTGLQYERGLLGHRHVGPRWRNLRITAVAGAGFSSIGAGHAAMMDVPAANGGAAWLAARLEWAGGAAIDDGLTVDFGFGIAIGSVTQVVNGIQRVSFAARPGVTMRLARLYLTFSFVLEQSIYAWSQRTDLVPDGWFQEVTPGFEVGLGAAF